MKVARIASAHYPEFIRRLYTEAPSLKNDSYEAQKILIKQQGFHQYFGYEDEFRKLGYDAVDIVFDLISLQTQWAREHGLGEDIKNIALDPKHVLVLILIAQLKAFQPDVLFVHNVRLFDGGLWEYIRTQVPSIKWVVATLTFISKTPMQLMGIDSLLCCTPAFLNAAIVGDLPSEVMYYCFNPTKFESSKKSGFTFFGSTGTAASMHHRERYRYLLYLLAATPLTVFGRETGRLISNEATIREIKSIKHQLLAFEHSPNPIALDKVVNSLSSHKVLPELSALFSDRVIAEKSGADYIEGLRNSLISFNIHTNLAMGTVGNMRMFEATGSGSCMLVEQAANLADVFEPDKEVVTYTSPQEASDKANWLLSHPQEAESIARAGFKRVAIDHGFANRAAQISEHLARVAKMTL